MKHLTHSRSNPYLQVPSDHHHHPEEKLKFVFFEEASDGTDAVKMVQEESDK